jgi:uncharacterized membrane protein YgcG
LACNIGYVGAGDPANIKYIITFILISLWFRYARSSLSLARTSGYISLCARARARQTYLLRRNWFIMPMTSIPETPDYLPADQWTFRASIANNAQLLPGVLFALRAITIFQDARALWQLREGSTWILRAVETNWKIDTCRKGLGKKVAARLASVLTGGEGWGGLGRGGGGGRGGRGARGSQANRVARESRKPLGDSSSMCVRCKHITGG